MSSHDMHIRMRQHWQQNNQRPRADIGRNIWQPSHHAFLCLAEQCTSLINFIWNSRYAEKFETFLLHRIYSMFITPL